MLIDSGLIQADCQGMPCLVCQSSGMSISWESRAFAIDVPSTAVSTWKIKLYRLVWSIYIASLS